MRRMRCEALFFDVDGTLKGFAGVVPPSAVEALRIAHARGIRLFVASGRLPAQIAEAVEGLPFDGYVACNGACCFDGAWQPLARTALPRADVERLVARLKEGRGPTVTFMYGDRMAASRADEEVEALMKHCGVDPPCVEEPCRALREEVYQASLFVGPEEERRLMDELLPGCIASRWHPAFADVNARGCDKRSGMERMLKHFGISAERTMAFGDGGNDIPMLRAAAVGVAMGGAAAEVRLAADWVTSAPEEEGIARALRRYGVI